MANRGRWLVIAAGIVWFSATGWGFKTLVDYSVRPGTAASAPWQWPATSRIPAPAGRHVLIMALHPHCPCSRASIIELNALMMRLRNDDVSGYVLVMKPAGFADEWTRTESYRSATRMPGVTVLVDVDGEEASRFGAHTSGQVVLYGGDGRLLFAGGVTPDRGHLGDSPGRQRILSLVKTGRADATESLVFGCPLGAKLCPLPPKKEARAKTGRS